MSYLAVVLSGIMLFVDIDIQPVIDPIMAAFNDVLFPIFICIISIIGIPLLVKRGIKIAQAEDENQKLAAQKAMTGAIIGIVIAFVVIVGFRIAMPIITEWVKANAVVSVT